ncbi:MAG: SMC family ATPase [Treponema sp.]|nr:SMC family ATPase [Treponema sp.]
MKPLKLTMCAFGSYADLQEIDFRLLGSGGLYLITGETGSGKTTIFDAISFALFGRASGSGRSEYAMLRSDFAGENDKTFVELEFSAGGNPEIAKEKTPPGLWPENTENGIYNVRRTIKKTGQDVALTLPDGSSLGGDRAVKQKIYDIVGLDRDQFAQIVMIAQNDFLRFLQSGTEERVKILRRIFGTERLRLFQDRLKEREKREKEKRELLVHDFERYNVDVHKREEQFAAWELEIKADREKLEEIGLAAARCDDRRKELSAELAVARRLSGKFAELERGESEFRFHKEKAGDMERLGLKMARGETALRKVRPFDEQAERTRLGRETAEAALTEAKLRQEGAGRSLADAENLLAGLPPLLPARENLTKLSGEWELAGQRQKKLSLLQKDFDRITERERAYSETERARIATGEFLQGLPSPESERAALDMLSKKLTNNQNTLSELSTLQADLDEIGRNKKSLETMRTEFAELETRFAEIAERHDGLESEFLRGQAGILAGELAEGKPCPVCGSTAHPRPAERSGGQVTEAELQKARQEKESVRKRREEKSLECHRLADRERMLTDAFLAAFSRLPDRPEETPDIAAAESSLPKMTKNLRERTGELEEKKTADEKLLAELITTMAAETEKLAGLNEKKASLEGELAGLKNRFAEDFAEFVPEATRENSAAELAPLLKAGTEAERELAARKGKAERELEELAGNREKAERRKAEAELACRESLTLVAERGRKAGEETAAAETARVRFLKALSDEGFSCGAEYRSSLLTEEELGKAARIIGEYEKSGERLAGDIARLRAELEGKSRADIGELERRAEKAEEEAAALNGEGRETAGRLERRLSVLAELRKAAAEFEKTERSYGEIRQLHQAANGRLDFETYAQTAYFHRVLEAANRRLKVMSQGRYALLRRTEAGDGRQRTGLETQVLDAYTGKVRSSGSLSGGESFLASLSLALGLSDTVQQSAGGVRLEAMFVDEGFGTLDTETLDLAMRALDEVSGGRRLVGIISHVGELRERVDRQIRVEKSPTGSRVKVIA